MFAFSVYHLKFPSANYWDYHYHLFCFLPFLYSSSYPHLKTNEIRRIESQWHVQGHITSISHQALDPGQHSAAFHPVMFSHSSSKGTALSGHVFSQNALFPDRVLSWPSTAFWTPSTAFQDSAWLCPDHFTNPVCFDPTSFLSVLQTWALSSLERLDET